MTITPDTVAHVAKLARLELTSEEVQRYTVDLGKILSLVEQLNTVDLSQMEVEMDVTEAAVLREDKANREFTRDELMSNAPDVEDGFFRVPKILGDNAG